MVRSSRRWLSLLMLLVCFAIAGCGGPKPLVMKKANPDMPGPWCGANQRVAIGERVAGQVPDGNRWKIFLVDGAGREHDPEKIAEQVWSYLERTGEARKITDAYRRDATYSSMAVVSIDPLVVILEAEQNEALRKHLGAAPDRSYWVAQVYALREPFDKEGLRWFSPDLKQGPTPLKFNEAGMAEIPLTNGKITLTRENGACRSARE